MQSAIPPPVQATKGSPPATHAVLLAYLALLASPLFFSTNVVFGKAATDIAPFMLAFLRWGITGFILLILCRSRWPAMVEVARSNLRLLFTLGFLGMFICGAIVYFALRETSATNGTLIYTIPPVIIILIERLWRGRLLRWREVVGVALAIAGVCVIVARGSFAALIALEFNSGDLLFLLAAASWALYSVLLKSPALQALGTLPLFALIALFGALILLPFAAYEFVIGIDMPTTPKHWSIIAGIVVLSSLISFSTFQHGVHVLGAPIAGIFMYLLPPFGVGFAWFFLGESIKGFHITGIIVILAGIILATFPVGLFTKRSP